MCFADDQGCSAVGVLRVSFFFFFSSRRRHTRFDCDWSSDVCSSDLCMPGSPHCQVDSEILYIRSRARSFSFGCASLTFFVHQSLSSITARMKSSVTRTEWFAFWKKIEVYASPSIAAL